MSNKILWTADVHLQWKLFNIPELESDLRQVLSNLVDVAIKSKCSIFAICGDLYDIQKPTAETVGFVTTLVDHLKANGVTPVVISGDHDKPVNNVYWGTGINGFVPMSHIPEILGIDYNDDPEFVMNRIRNCPKEKADQVKWLALHGQVPGMFPFVTEKKRLDIKIIDLFAKFPKLNAVILGDIHNPIQDEITDPRHPGRVIKVMYCGSPGLIKTDELAHKKSYILTDGDSIETKPIPLVRPVLRLNFTGSNVDAVLVQQEDLVKQKWSVKPIFIVDYDESSKEHLHKLAKLYEVGIVRSIRQISEQQDGNLISLRSELPAKHKVEEALIRCVKTTEAFDLALAILTTEEPKVVLDNFAKETLNIQ